MPTKRNICFVLVGTLWTFSLLLGACAEGNPSTVAEVAAPTPAAETVAVEPGSCGLFAEGETPSDEDAVRRVLTAEGELVVSQNISALMSLWSDESQIVDAKNTADDTSDDQVWNGKDAIRNRYVRVVFPGAPDAVQPSDLQIELLEGSAIVTATTQIGNEISPRGDRWQLIQHDGCWLLESLTYNLEATAE